MADGRSGSRSAAIKRSQAIGLRDIFLGVGIEEWIQWRRRPGNCCQWITRGPAVDLPHALDDQRLAQLVAQAHAPEADHRMCLVAGGSNCKYGNLGNSGLLEPGHQIARQEWAIAGRTQYPLRVRPVSGR